MDAQNATPRSTSGTVPKRTVTKPIAPRLSSTTTRPTATSTTKATTTTTTPNSLSKPPARPTTASTVRRPPSSAATTSPPSTVRRTRLSITSVDASGDESKKDGITARPKRLSTASATSTVVAERPATANTKPVAATPARRTPTVTSATIRAGVKSPTTTRSPAAAATHTRTTSTLSSRPTRPPSSAATRPATTLAERKRLSTIPASPAVKAGTKTTGDADSSGARQVRPALGRRQSTRSTLIEQRIREFELVNQMLQSAMTADGMESEEQEHVESEAKKTMDKLRADLAKLRSFEKEHGRIPTEDELANMDDVTEELAQKSLEEEPKPGSSTSDAEIANLKAQVEDSLAQNTALKTQLEETTAKLETFAKRMDEEGSLIEETTKTLKTQHAEALEKLQIDHQSKILDLEIAKEQELVSFTAEHKSEIEALMTANEKALAEKTAELAALQTEVNLFKDTKDTMESREVELEKSRDELRKQAKNASQKDEQLSQLKSEVEILRGGDVKVLAMKDAELESIRNELNELKLNQLPRTQEESVPGDSEQEKELATLRQELGSAKELATQAEGNAKSNIVKMSEEHAKKMTDIEKSHAAQVVELEEEVGTLKTEVASKHDEVHKTTEALEKANQQLKAMKESNDADVKAASQSVEKLKADHAEQIKAAETKVVALQSELEVAARSKENQENQTINTYQEDLANLRKELEAARSSHGKEILELQDRLSDKETQLDLAKSEKDRIFKLHEHSQASTKEQELKVQEYLDKLKATEAEHDKALEAARAEADTTHSQAIEQLKAAHNDEIRALEQQMKSSLNELEEVDAALKAEIQQTKSNAALAQEEALREQAESHDAVFKELQAKFIASQNQVASLKGKHEGSLSKAQSDHVSDKESALAVLNAEHERKIADLTTEYKSSQYNALEALKKAHVEEHARTDAQLKVVSEENESAKVQVQSLKEILHSLDSDAKTKEQEHKRNIETLESELQRSRVKLSEQSEVFANAEMQHAQQLEQLKSTSSKEIAATLAALETKHQQALESLRKELEQNHEEALALQAEEHTKMIKNLQEDASTKDSDIENLKAEHAEALRNLQTTSQMNNEKVLDQLRAEHAGAAEKLQASLSQYQVQFAAMEQEHASQLAGKSKEVQSIVESTKTEHQGVISKLQSELDALRSNNSKTSEIDALKSQLAASQKSLERMQEAQAEMMSSITKDHEYQLSKLNNELESLRSATSEVQDSLVIELLKAQLAEASGKHDDITRQHAEVIQKKDSEHQKVTTELQTQIGKLKTNAAPQVSDKEGGENSESQLAEARKTVVDLSEQYANAALEAENQRVIADKAQRELKELKQSLLQTEYRASNAVSSKKIKTKGLEASKPGKASPKAGLGASKWAEAEAEDTGSTNTPPSGIDEASATTASTKGKPQLPRSAAGQMAGIQESIRQLDEMSNDLLDENQKLAKTLNKVRSGNGSNGTKKITKEDTEGKEEEL